MAYQILSSKITGKPDKGFWSQVYDFQFGDDLRQKKLGHLYALISISEKSDPGLVDAKEADNVIVGREILARLHEEYFGKNGDNALLKSEGASYSPLLLLKNALKSVISEFSDRMNVEIAAMLGFEKIIYLAVVGGSRFYILRQGSLYPLLVSENETVKSASGYIKPDDTLLLGTGNFFREFALGVLRANLLSRNPQDFAEFLVPQIHSMQNAGRLGAIVLNFKNTDSSQDEKFKVNRDFLSEKNKESERVQVTSESVQKPIHAPPKLKYDIQFFKNKLKKKIYVEDSDKSPETVKRKKVWASVGLILLALLAVSIVFGVRQKRFSDARKSYEEDLTFAKHNLEEAENLVSLNPARARELFLEGRARVLGINSEGLDDSELNEIKKKIENAQGKILGEYETSLGPFLDLDLLTQGFRGDELSFSNGNVYISDKSGKKIVEVSISTKRAEVIAGPGKIDEFLAISSYFDKVYVFNSQGIFDVSGEKIKVSEDSWSGNILSQAFSGNLYVLEKSTSLIWRLTGDGQVFSKKTQWISDQALVDLSSAKSMAIDGDVWVLGEGGEVDKFQRGNILNFKLSGDLEADFDPDYLYTDEDTDSLYFLDREKGEISVYDKEGKYFARYLASEFKNTSQFVVSETIGKIILLNGSNLYSLELKHL